MVPKEIASWDASAMRSLSHVLVCSSACFVSFVFIGACFSTDGDSPEQKGSLYLCDSAVDVECSVSEELALDAVSSLGFSASDVLPSIVGNYEIPIRWVSPCVDVTACGAGADCSRFAEQPPVSVAGTKTTLSVELAASGGPAAIMAPGPGQDACGQYMQIPGVLSVKTEDGAVDMERDVVIWTECGKVLRVGVVGPASELGGTLGAELGESVVSQVTFNATIEDRVSFSLTCIRQVENAPRPIGLRAETLLDDALCDQGGVPRGKVLVGAE